MPIHVIFNFLEEQGCRSSESTRLQPMWPGFDSRTRRHMWVEFVVGSRLCSERFFSGYSGFPLFSKTDISKFQFDLDYYQVLYHEPLAREIVKEHPVLLTLNKLLVFLLESLEGIIEVTTNLHIQTLRLIKNNRLRFRHRPLKEEKYNSIITILISVNRTSSYYVCNWKRVMV